METFEQKEGEPTKLDFEFSVKQDTDRIKNTLQKAGWYQKNGYKPKMPKDLSLEEMGDLSEEEVKKIIADEFDGEEYKSIISKIEEDWEKFEPQLRIGLANLGIDIDTRYQIMLTRYGTGGSYNNNWNPKGVTVNIAEKQEVSVIAIICHEIVHLCIQDLIEKYNVSHWSKEHIVDLIIKSIFADERMQKIDPILASQIDEIFGRDKTNIEDIIKKVGNLKQ